MSEWLNSYQQEQWVSTFDEEPQWMDEFIEYTYSTHHNLVLQSDFYYLTGDGDTHNIRARNDFLYLQIQGGV